MNPKTLILRLLLASALQTLACQLKGDDSAPFTILHSFSDKDSNGANSDGYLTQGGLVQGKDGNFYGANFYGGTYGHGVIFRISPAGDFTPLHSFSAPSGKNFQGLGTNSEGECAWGGVIQGTDGRLYGTTSFEGPAAYGTVYSFSPSDNPQAKAVHGFNHSDGEDCRSPLVQGPDGALYGTTLYGGANDQGTVFKVTPKGDFHLLYSFSPSGFGTANADGIQPNGLVLGKDGNLYGTTQFGGAAGEGTIFKITPAGVFTSLYSFAHKDGKEVKGDGEIPGAGLIVGWNGDFYGTTNFGGDNGNGTIFRCTPTGKVSILYSFEKEVGPYHNKLVEVVAGFFCGSTSAGGPDNHGMIYRLRIRGDTELTIVKYLNEKDTGIFPSNLIKGTDGNFYGTMDFGGAYGHGTVFMINLINPVITSLKTATAKAGQPFSYQTTATYGAYQFAAAPLPGSLKIDEKTGKISGTAPTTPGPYHIGLKASNALGSGSAELILTVEK